MTRDKNVDSWISEHDPALRQIAETLRNIILSTEPDLTESIKWSQPVYSRKGRVCYLSATERYVSLGFFNGASLTDPQGRIEGTGVKLRHVKVRSLEDIDMEQIGSWVREAVAIDERVDKGQG